MPVCTSARPRVDRERRHVAVEAEAVFATGRQDERGGRRVDAQRRGRRGRPADQRTSGREREQIDRQGFEARAPIERDAGAIAPEHLPVGLRRGRGDRRRTRGRPARAAWRRRRGSTCAPLPSSRIRWGGVSAGGACGAGWAIADAPEAPRATARASGRAKTSTFMCSFRARPWHRTDRPAVLQLGLATYSNGRGGATERLTPNA